ncbi:hypothetical protein, partial [Calothrix sp. UHCC 0171]|uniref:hypothetical protein n=1 Tax=Calothrix sp. UHCC 0171 TaxID=3110245 RepID=UPI002B1FD954
LRSFSFSRSEYCELVLCVAIRQKIRALFLTSLKSSKPCLDRNKNTTPDGLGKLITWKKLKNQDLRT